MQLFECLNRSRVLPRPRTPLQTIDVAPRWIQLCNGDTHRPRPARCRQRSTMSADASHPSRSNLLGATGRAVSRPTAGVKRAAEVLPVEVEFRRSTLTRAR